MGNGQTTDERQEITRLLDEIEQLRTALEASSDEAGRLAEDRDRLLRRLTAQARELQAANSAYAQQASDQKRDLEDELGARLQAGHEQEELRVAFEEMQVLTEELEVANNSLQQANRVLDRRVEERTLELAAKNNALAASELRFRTLVEGMPQLVWRSAEGGEWTWASPQWIIYTGLSAEDSAGLGWLRALHPEDRTVARSAWARAEAGGPLDIEGRIFHEAERRYRHFRTRATAVQGEDGRILEWLGTSTDVDDLLRLQTQQRVLVAELQHRTRNLMGVVRSMAENTLSASTNLPDFEARFRDRLEALSRVQGLLSRLDDHDRVTFDDLIRTELSAMGAAAEQVTLSGPSGVRLRSSTVQTLALALHELATNALKYGALGQPSARLAISWSLEATGEGEQPWLHIDWRESGVRMPATDDAPTGTGHGRELIEQALPYQLNARTSHTLGPDGVHCLISIPVSASTMGRASQD